MKNMSAYFPGLVQALKKSGEVRIVLRAQTAPPVSVSE